MSPTLISKLLSLSSAMKFKHLQCRHKSWLEKVKRNTRKKCRNGQMTSDVFDDELTARALPPVDNGHHLHCSRLPKIHHPPGFLWMSGMSAAVPAPIIVMVAIHSSCCNSSIIGGTLVGSLSKGKVLPWSWKSQDLWSGCATVGRSLGQRLCKMLGEGKGQVKI